MCAIFGAKAPDRHHITRHQCVFSPALAIDHVWRAALECPVHHFAVFVFHVHIEINVWIHELHFGNGSCQGEGIVPVEFYRESVVRKNGGRCSEQEKYYAKCNRRRGSQNRTSKNDCELAFLYNLRIRWVKQDDFAAVSQFGSGRSK